MLKFTGLVAALAAASFTQLPCTNANADPASGHVRNVKPTAAWLSKNQPLRKTSEIQASECGINTRLSFPNVQLFAWFRVNHDEDGYHGCPYGDCWAYTTFPGPDDLEIDFTWSYVWFWHGVGGIPGTGVKLISDPQTGALGYEQSLSGKFHVGAIPAGTLQVLHDENYPGFKPNELHPWPPGAADRFLWAPEPKHIKCGLPCEENKDPGIKPGAYGYNMYKPASADQYPPPPGWKPTPRDKCPTNGTTPAPDQCGSFCSCVSQCKDDTCISKCRGNAKGTKCDQSKCPTPPAPSPNHPTPGNDPDKCLNYCSCLDHCEGDKDCINSKCKSIKHGCKTAKCSSIQPPTPSPPSTDPKYSSPRPGGQESSGQISNNPTKKGSADGNGYNVDHNCQNHCKCAAKCKDEACKQKCPNADQCSADVCKPSKRASRKKAKACP